MAFDPNKINDIKDELTEKEIKTLKNLNEKEQKENPDRKPLPEGPVTLTPWTATVDNSKVDADKFKFDAKKEFVAKPTNIDDLQYIFADIFAGDKDALSRPEFKCLNINEMKAALDWLANNNSISKTMMADMAQNAWRLNFRDRPPTMEEFLTPKYIGDQANTLFTWLKKAMIEFTDPMKPFRTLVLSTCIGAGKALTLDSKVYIDKDHYKLNKDLQIGDKILSPGTNGQQTEVVAIYDWDPEDIFELEMDNGKKMYCGINHIHHVSYKTDSNGNKIWENVDTKFILEHPDIEFEFPEESINENAKIVN